MDFLGWLYFKNYGRDTFAVYPVNSTNLVAEVQGETNARLISKAPEMYQALFYANQTIKATIEYMKTKKFITEDLVAIVTEIDRILDDIEGKNENSRIF